MQIYDLKSGKAIFQALDSEIRLQIMDLLLSHINLNMKEIAMELNLSNSAITMHIKKLEECGLINIKMSNGKHGMQKICSLNDDKIIIELKSKDKGINSYQVEISVGHYSDYQIFPTCGLASHNGLIGEVDDPRYFADPDRINAEVVWFSKGFLEYKIPNYIKPGEVIKEIQISLEISSEAPGYCEFWPSDIYINFNDIELGYWTSPGDYGEKRGIYNPYWWPNWNQHGVLKLLSISQAGTFIDGRKISKINLEDLQLTYKSDFSLKLGVPDKANNIGGLTIFGNNFGNYNQGIKVSLLCDSK